MFGLDAQSNDTHWQTRSSEDPVPIATHCDSALADASDLMQMQSFLVHVVGRKATDAMLDRSLQICGQYATEEDLRGGLFQLCTELLGDLPAQHMLHYQSC
jgi:hypothetical protein